MHFSPLSSHAAAIWDMTISNPLQAKMNSVDAHQFREQSSRALCMLPIALT